MFYFNFSSNFFLFFFSGCVAMLLTFNNDATDTQNRLFCNNNENFCENSKFNSLQ